jgi:hypothetical protein
MAERMALQHYKIEWHDENAVMFKSATIKAANETDGLREAKGWARGEKCAFFLVRGKRNAIIYDSRDEA